MKRVSNYHSHVALCGHAEGKVEDYVLEAIKHNYEEIGISDHAPIPVYFVGKENHEYLWLSQMMNRETFENDYLKQIDYCIEKYSDKIKILKGLEVEFIPSKDYYYQYLLTKVQYLNLGVHYFFKNGEVINSYGYLNEDDLDWYAKTIEEAVRTNYFSCLVHPDLFLYHIDEFTKYHEIISRRIIEACIKNDVYLEVNCNGRDRYPRKEFWNIVNEYKEAKIIINNDAHKVSNFHGENVFKVIEFCQNLNLNIQEKMTIKNNKFKTLFVGHRGSSLGPVVNNTLSGFKLGIERKYYALECDVRVTTDGVYYIHHDPTITLYNNNFVEEEIKQKGISPDDSMQNFSWDQIKDLTLYYTFEEKKYYDKLILFEDYIKLCKDNKIKCVIELKYTNGINTNDTSKIDGLIEIIEKHQMMDNVFILTSMKNCLLYIKSVKPLMNIVLLTGEATTNMENVEWCIENNASMDGYYPLMTQEIIDTLRANELSSNAWTINKQEACDVLKEMKVDFITSDVITK